MVDKTIRIWQFQDAPEEYRNQSTSGGDEDWVALVPSSLKEVYIPWLEYGSFGICDIEAFPQSDGSTLYIGSHA